MNENNQTLNSPMAEMKIEVKELPSRGLGYPTGLAFYYRSYTYGEIKKVSTSNDIDLPQIIEAVMSGVSASDETFNKYNMSFVDMLYIGLLRRVSSQGHLKYQVPYVCEGCEKQSTAVFSSSDLDFESIREEVRSLPIEVDIAGKTFQFTFPTVQNMLDAKKSSKGKNFSPAMEVQARTVINMDFQQAYASLSSLTDQDDIDLLDEVDRMLNHTIKPIKSVCKLSHEGKTCGHVNYVNIEGKELLIKPFREGEGPARNKIRFIGE